MSTLWMGNLQSYMNEDYIHRAFGVMGEAVRRVRLIHNKITGDPAGYCFVEFPDEATAERCLRRVNGKPLPGATPPKRFKLNRATYGRQLENSPTFSLFVSNLSSDVDDGMLYEFFCNHFPSCYAGKIVLDSKGYSKCCGFVSFSSSRDQEKALAELQGAIGLGKNPLHLDLASNKPYKKQHPEDQTWLVNAETYSPNHLYQFYYHQYSSYYSAYYRSIVDYNPYTDFFQNYDETEDNSLEYPNLELDVLEANRKFMEESEELYVALNSCYCQPAESWGGMISIMSNVPEPVCEYLETVWQ